MTNYNATVGRWHDVPSAAAMLNEIPLHIPFEVMLDARKCLRRNDALDLAPMLGLTVDDLAGAR